VRALAAHGTPPRKRWLVVVLFQPHVERLVVGHAVLANASADWCGQAEECRLVSLWHFGLVTAAEEGEATPHAGGAAKSETPVCRRR